MTNRHALTPASLLVLLLVVLAPAAHGEKFTVGDPGLDTIQQAVDAALANTSSKDTILVPAGVYTESVFVSFASLTTSNWQEKLSIKQTGTGEVRIVGQSSQPAIHLQDVSGVILKNLTLDSGSSADSVSALRIDGLTQNVSCEGLLGVPGDDVGVAVIGSTVQGVKLESCDFSGMFGIGFWIDGVSHELKECIASQCGLNAIVLPATSLNCTVRKCEAYSSGGQSSLDPGVVTIRGSGHRVSKTLVSGGGADGFFITGQSHSLSECESSSNAVAGYNVDGADAFLEDSVSGSNLIGYLGGGEGARIDGGKFKKNSSHGIMLMDSGTSVRSVSASGNGGSGIYVLAGVVGTNIQSCKFQNNGGEGVLVEGQFTWLEGNTAKKGDGLVNFGGANNGGRDNTVIDGGANDF